MKKGDIMMSTLFINACVRENSRTLMLARNILKDIPGEIIEVDLNQESIAPLNRELLEERESLLRDGNKNDPMFYYARQFAEADEIVIAAPLTRELLEERESLLRDGNKNDPMFCYARQFAEADEIVIAAPFWDLSFPALLKP